MKLIEVSSYQLDNDMRTIRTDWLFRLNTLPREFQELIYKLSWDMTNMILSEAYQYCTELGLNPRPADRLEDAEASAKSAKRACLEYLSKSEDQAALLDSFLYITSLIKRENQIDFELQKRHFNFIKRGEIQY